MCLFSQAVALNKISIQRTSSMESNDNKITNLLGKNTILSHLGSQLRKKDVVIFT
jgi:hypothetical protein